jgi:hypothetical protein
MPERRPGNTERTRGLDSKYRDRAPAARNMHSRFGAMCHARTAAAPDIGSPQGLTVSNIIFPRGRMIIQGVDVWNLLNEKCG